MIESISVFILKSGICSALFLAYYLLVLKNVKMHTFNRIYLLSSAFLSLALPLAKLNLLSVASVAVPDFPLLTITGKSAGEKTINAAANDAFNWQGLFVVIYFAVSVIVVAGLLLKILRIYQLKNKGQVLQKEGYLLVVTNDSRAPFSFMNMLFWPPHLCQESAEGNRILMHEMAHINQFHTLDKILLQLILAACWANPFNWVIKKELWLQHEFLADKNAIKDGNTESFARMLLYSATGYSNVSVVNPFFQSSIKRRLLMLTKPGSNTHYRLRSFLSIPVLFVAMLLLSANVKNPATMSHSHDKIVLVLDAAHGGKDVGGKGAYGEEEKNVTLALCKKMVRLSDQYNIKIITTRDEDRDLTLEDRINKCNNTPGAIFLSVHVNQSSAVRDNTYQLGVNPQSKNYNKSILLASSIANRLKAQKLPVEIIDHSMSYILRENKQPAILIECGNLDDINNIALLKDEARTEELCRNLLSGIADYAARLEKQANNKTLPR